MSHSAPLNRTSLAWMAWRHFTVITGEIPMLYNPVSVLVRNANVLYSWDFRAACCLLQQYKYWYTKRSFTNITYVMSPKGPPHVRSSYSLVPRTLPASQSRSRPRRRLFCTFFFFFFFVFFWFFFIPSRISFSLSISLVNIVGYNAMPWDVLRIKFSRYSRGFFWIRITRSRWLRHSRANRVLNLSRR